MKLLLLLEGSCLPQWGQSLAQGTTRHCAFSLTLAVNAVPNWVLDTDLCSEMQNGIWPCVASSSKPSHTSREVTSPRQEPLTLYQQSYVIRPQLWVAPTQQCHSKPRAPGAYRNPRSACRDSTMWQVSSYCTLETPAHITPALFSQIPKVAAALFLQESQKDKERDGKGNQKATCAPLTGFCPPKVSSAFPSHHLSPQFISSFPRKA